MSNRTLPFFVPALNPSIGGSIAPIGEDYQTLSTTETKEVVADAASGGVWVKRSPLQVSRTGFDGITPGNVCNAGSVEHIPTPFIFVSVTTSPPCGLSGSLQVAKKYQYTSPGLGGNTQKLDAIVDGNLPNDMDYAPIFSKVISHKLSDGSRNDLYLRFRMNPVNDHVQTQSPHFMDMGLLDINTLNESGVLSTPATSIQRPVDISHWSVLDNVLMNLQQSE